MNVIRKFWPFNRRLGDEFRVVSFQQDRRNRRQKESYQLIEVDRKRLREARGEVPSFPFPFKRQAI